MSVPCFMIGKSAIGMCDKRANDASAEPALAHVGERLIIDDIVAKPPAQQAQEVEATL